MSPSVDKSSWLSRVFEPKTDFFALLNIQSATTLDGIIALDAWINEGTFERCQKVRDLENDADEHKLELERKLVESFITPFDREDIHALASALDDIADYIYATAKKLNFYKVEPTSDQGIIKMADAIKESVLSVNRAVLELRNLKNINKVVECVIKINGIENQVDDIFDLSIENLFENETDIKLLIKKREIYQNLEKVTDKCEDAGNVMESIVVKYA